MPLRLVHTADNHLDPKLSYLGSKALDRRLDFYKSFLRVVEFVLERKPHLFLVSGDLFDSINPRNPVRTRVLQAFRRITSEGIKAFVIGGNHDMPRSQEEGMSPIGEIEAAGYATFFPELDEFRVEHLKVEGLDVAVTGLSFDPTLEISSNPLRDRNLRIPIEGDINIAMLHYNFAGFKIPKNWAAPTITPADLPEGLNYLAMGHLHGHSYTTIKETLVVYPGSTERRSFNEETDDKKGFVYVELTGNSTPRLEFIEVPTRPMKTFEVTLDETVDEPVTRVLKAVNLVDQELLARIVIKGSLPVEKMSRYSKAELLNKLANNFFHVVVDDSGLKSLFKEIKLTSDISSPIDSYKEYFNEALSNVTGEEADILRLALEIGLKVLQEVGAW
ncbi:metallophosphoesterase family protein [Infirmifilum sp.]|uniref:metallophosphoesterase family protein n=1 Tax=Infirmifilum sp. TaxID=2856575 RepID=UPI003D11FD3F